MDRSSGWAIWLTGLPASGKTTLAQVLQRKLDERGISVVLLDSDEVRRILTPRATYTPAERDSFYDRLVAFAVWLVGCGENAIIVATGSQSSYRASARAQLAPRFAEVWVRCPVEVCRGRDPKGLYAGAAAGLIHNLPGIDAPYEEPAAPEVIVDTDRQTPEQAAEIVLASLPFAQGSVNRQALRQGLMSTPPTVEALQQQIAALEAELARLRPLEAAAREAYAFFVGRRPGFAQTYPRDVLLAAFEPNTPRPRKSRSKPARSIKRRKQA